MALLGRTPQEVRSVGATHLLARLLHPHRLHLAQELTIEGPGAAVAAATAMGAAMAVAADAE